jgi:hypothetical protein
MYLSYVTLSYTLDFAQIRIIGAHSFFPANVAVFEQNSTIINRDKKKGSILFNKILLDFAQIRLNGAHSS